MTYYQQDQQQPVDGRSSNNNNTTHYGSASARTTTRGTSGATHDTHIDDEARGNNQHGSSSSDGTSPTNKNTPTNEYVLNVAFLSFVGFMALQACFALVAHSQSMMADSEAMSVDALTYLFNMCAERMKHRPLTEAELRLPLAVREHRREMKRLYLELIPPLISVATLILVTMHAISEAWETLYGVGKDDVDDVSAGLMLCFSGLNLLLDVVNVTCFARANQAYGLQKNSPSSHIYHDVSAASPGSSSNKDETNALIPDQPQQVAGLTLLQGNTDLVASDHDGPHDDYLESWFGDVNLNMCSAWTHICADTMRSAAVLVAAGIAFFFDSVPSDKADSWAAVAVSVTILLSLVPLLRGLFVTARQIVVESQNKPAFIIEY